MLLTYWQGRNDSINPSLGINFYLGGAANVDLQLLNIQIKDRKTNGSLLYESIEGTPLLVKKIYIKFPPNGVLPGGEFDIEINYKWPGAIGMSTDSVFYITQNYKKGVDFISSKIKFNTPPSWWCFTRYDFENHKLIPEHTKVEKRENNVLCWEKGAPNGIFVLSFTREIQVARS